MKYKKKSRYIYSAVLLLFCILTFAVPAGATAARPIVLEHGTWIQSGDSWWYQEADGTFPASEWKQIQQYWYYFDQEGWMVTGWLQDAGETYYLQKSGAMAVGWLKIGEDYYYFASNGAMQRDTWIGEYYVDADGVWIEGAQKQTDGWSEINGSWKYYQEDGTFLTERWLKWKTKWYYFDREGWMATGWEIIDGDWYYFDETGIMQTGWQLVKGKMYYMKSSGEMAYSTWVDGYYVDGYGARVTEAGWIEDQGKWRYLEDGGTYIKETWKLLKNIWYYFDKDGWAVTEWKTVKEKIYYFDENCAMVTGWRIIEGDWYYFNTEGAMVTGWQKSKNIWYYLDPETGIMLTGWQKIENIWYYLDGNGRMQTGWLQDKGTWYYLEDSGAMAVGWKQLDGEWYYLNQSGAMVTGWQEISGYKYYFKSSGAMAYNTTIDGIILGSGGQALDGKSGVRTIRGFLSVALQPVGQTMYIWGGGHDSGSGGDAVRIGVNPNWKTFYQKQNGTYDYTKYKYWYGYGLDCSGFVGWSVYNTLNKEPNKESYSSTSTLMPDFLANTKGLGTVDVISGGYKAGDIVCHPGHVWIVIGSCSDGSVVVVHATMPFVQIAGTVSSTGSTNSEAIKLARKYMEKYYAEATATFNLSIGDKSYLTNTTRFQWNSSIVSDPEGLRNMSAEQVLKSLFGES